MTNPLSIVVGNWKRRPDTAPDEVLTARQVPIIQDHLSGYSKVCGFRVSDRLPATYPQVLAFPTMMALLTRDDFPFPLLGLVHLRNTIHQRRPILAAERPDLTVRAENLRAHPRGRLIDVVTTATVDGLEVWTARAAYLRREDTGAERVATERLPAPPPSAIWRVGTEVGTDYAAVSGDRNPIHTSQLGARLLGFPAPIAHGMWTKARCLAALEGRLPDAYTVDVTFKRPVLLPATVAFSSTSTPDGRTFSLHDARSPKPHLSATLTP